MIKQTLGSVLTRPTVSVIMPCRNEERFIRASLASLLSGSWPPAAMELVVVDGRSTDRTREIVQELVRTDPRVRLVDNPQQVTPAALNAGIRAAHGDIIVRVDAHTTYPREYVAVLVRALEETGADLVGCGEQPTPANDGVWARAISLALSGPFGTGSAYRYRRQSGPVDTVPFGCWRRALFDRVGLFDERLLRNQDYEHASRIRKHGGRVFLTTEAHIRYHPRASVGALCRQAAETGMWNAFTERLHPYTFRLRHVLPGPFLLWVLAALALILFGHGSTRTAGALMLAPYALANVLSSLWLSLVSGAPQLAPLVAGVVAAHHLAYGYGICKGWLLVASGRWRWRLGQPGDGLPQPSSESAGA